MSRLYPTTFQPRRQRGASLIEVLITVLILAIGLLGLSALQLTALKNNQSAMQRSVAVLQSYSIIEAMRADSDAAKQGNFNIVLNGTPASSTGFAKTVHTLWYEQLQTHLGSTATGSVACTNNRCIITVQWDDSRASQEQASDNSATTQQVVTEVML